MKNRIILLIILLLPVAVLYNAGLLELRLEEPRRALVALEMLLRKSFLVPEINGELYYTKPPLFNWLIALSFWIAGNYSEWAARLPGLLSYFATGLVLYWFAKKFFTKEKALLATFFFYTASDLLLFGTIISAEIDLFFAFVITLQQVLLYYFFSRKQWLAMFAASWAITALGILTKGVPSVLFQVVSVLVLCVYEKKIKLLISWQHFAGLLCFAAIAGAYFYAYQVNSGQLYPYLAKLYYDATEKSVLEHSVVNSLVNLLLSPLHLLRFFAPWFLYIVFLFKKAKSGGRYWQNNAIGFVTWSVIINIIPMLFTAETKANYIYPLFPLIAIILAHIYLTYKEINPKLDNILSMLFLALMVLVLAAVLMAPVFEMVRSGVPALWLKTIIVALLVAAIAWHYYKTTATRIYLLVLFMVTARLIISMYYLPLYKMNSTQQHVKDYIASVDSFTAGEPVSLGGAADLQKAYVAVGPLKLDTVKISMPPFIQYQVPFYYSAINKRVMQYEPVMKAGNFYMLYTEEAVDTNRIKVLNSYQPSKTKRATFYLVTPLK